MLSGKRKRVQPNVRVEVLDEGRIKKRKHQRAGRCHRDDEKERRRDIAVQFDLLKSFLRETRKNRTRQEMLSASRALIWELWRNEEILSLARVDQIGRRIAELEKQIVMKRDKKKQLLTINRTAAESTMTDYGPSNEEDESEEFLDPIVSRSLIEEDFSDGAQILTDDIVDAEEGYVLEEVLPPELYYQLANDELNKRHISEQQTEFTEFKPELLEQNDTDGMAESVIRDTFKVEEIHSSERESTAGSFSDVTSRDESIEVICDEGEEEEDGVYGSCGDQKVELQGDFRAGEGNRGMELEVDLQNTSCRIRDGSMANVGSQGSSACGNPDFNMNSADHSVTPNKDISQDSIYNKFPLPMPHQMSLYPHLMPIHFWPPFVQTEQQVGGYSGFSVPNMLVPNPSCVYSALPVSRESPPQSSLHQLVPCDPGQVIRSDHGVPEVSNNVDVVN